MIFRLIFMTAQDILLAFRPKTLTAAVVPVLVGTALIYSMAGPVKWWVSFFALAGALFIQIGTNLVNDAVDFRKGADTEERIGPRRATASGLIKDRTVMLIAVLSFVIAVAFGVPLVLEGGWVIIAIGLVSILCGYCYTGGPFPLAYRGLGDLFVVLFFGLVAVGGVFYLHSGNYSVHALWAGLQIGCHCTVLIAINNLRDVVGDEKVGKRTLAVRFGENFVRREIFVLTFLPFFMNAYWMLKGFYLAGAISMLALPLALPFVRGVFNNEPGPIYNKYLAQSAGLHLAFGVLLTLGFFLQRFW